MTNLFNSPTTLRNPKHMVGRRIELESIFEMIQTRQSAALVGPRRIGKTSLLTCLKDPEIQRTFGCDPNQFMFIYLDLQKYALKKEQVTFLSFLCQTIKEQSKQLELQFDDTLTEDDLFDALLDAFQKRECYPVLMLDAFDEINRYSSINEDVLGVLRAAGGAGKISYITASMNDLPAIFRKFPFSLPDGSSPFYNIFAIIRLQPFSLEEAQQLLFDTSERSGLRFSQEEVIWIIRQAGRHPYLLQHVGSRIFDAKRSNRGGNVLYAHLQKEVQQNLLSHFEDAWNMLSRDDRQRLVEDIHSMHASAPTKHQSLPNSGPSPSSSEEAQDHRGSFICSEFQDSELFYEYLHKTGKLIVSSPAKTDSPLSKIDLKLILEQFNDVNELGQSELIFMPFIAKRIEQQQAKDPALRGIIVQDTLRKAIERMQGQGIRNDSNNTSWLYYDILDKRYISKGSRSQTVTMIAQLLGYSDRQFYRYLEQALKRLKNELEAMNASAALEQRT